ncbi:MAG: tripartite tricarboxylate transporter TctB family protein [Gammaproteobacteria bacterium]|nr:tripartite tricarboxylate transporter TctB family protein [Gammaproteobacteria bacterium]
MTVRTAEIVVAIALALCSIGLMVKSAELNIGWIDRKGPGSGFWPFWLSAGMLLSCLLTIYRWFKRITPESNSSELYISGSTLKVVGTSAASILFLLITTQFMGIYIALFLFLLIYLRLIGGHSWALVLSLTICLPVFIFSLFEWGLKIPLPKAFTDEWFYPVFDLMYAQNTAGALAAFKAPIVSLPIFGVLAVAVYWIREYFSKRRISSTDSSSRGATETATD